MATEGHRDSVQEQLQEIERGEIASWVVYPPTPIWWPLAYGLWAATLTLAIGLLEGRALALVQLALVALMGLAVAWDRRRRGTYPSGRPPRELRPAMLRMVLGVTVVAGAAWLVGAQLSVRWAAAIAAVGSWAVVWWYEREYATIAARVRERLR